ncbi:MAG: PDZ domain-containing protein [Phycisphaerae bacterium]|nr:PDZ domain-containing protein [Phycisphaerae bacterium]
MEAARHHGVRLLCVGALLAATGIGLANEPAGPSVPADSLARYAPADARLFAELRGLRELEAQWSQSDWGTALLSMIIGRTDEPGSGNEALMPFGRILGLDDPVAIRRGLFGRQAAVALPNWTDLGHGVLLAVPDDVGPIEAALQQQGHKAEAVGQARQYQLNATHWLATNGHVLLFGQRADERCLYEHALQILAGNEQASLADDPAFQREREALGPGVHRGLLYFSDPATRPPALPSPTTQPLTTTQATSQPTTTQATSQPTTTQATTAPAATQPTERIASRWVPASWPRLWRGMVGVIVEGQTIRLNIRGQLDQQAPPHVRDANVEVVQTLPATTLAAWAQSIDYPAHYDALLQAPPTFLTLYLTYLDARMRIGGSSLRNGLLARLGDDTVAMLSIIPEAEQSEPVGFAIPALGAIIPVRESGQLANALDTLADALAGMFNLPSMRQQTNEPVRVEKVIFDDTIITQINIGSFFKTQTGCTYTHTLLLSWAITDHDLILSTHADHIRQILRARTGHAELLGSKIAAAGHLEAAPPGTDGVLVAQPAEIAAMFDGWMRYLEKNDPEILTAEWWRSRQQRQAARVSLGFGIDSRVRNQIVVYSTIPGWPAHGRLRPGDRILAADGTKVPETNPRGALKKLIADRKEVSQITLTVERDGSPQDLVIPLPEEPKPFDPVGAMRQVSKLLEPFAAATYSVWCTQPDRFNAAVTLRAAPAPTTTQATTAPATTQPATTPTTQETKAPAPTTAPVPAPPATAPSTQPATAPTTQPVSAPAPATKPAP